MEGQSLGETCCPPGVMEQCTGPTRYLSPCFYSSSSSSAGTNHQSCVGDGHFSKPFQLLKVVFFFRRMQTGSLQLSTGNESAIILECARLLASSCYLNQVFRSQPGKNIFSLLRGNNIQEKRSLTKMRAALPQRASPALGAAGQQGIC